MLWGIYSIRIIKIVMVLSGRAGRFFDGSDWFFLFYSLGSVMVQYTLSGFVNQGNPPWVGHGSVPWGNGRHGKSVEDRR